MRPEQARTSPLDVHAGNYDRLGPGMVRGFRLWRRYLNEIASAWKDDVLVISFPKAGRTWHRVALCKYLELLFDRPPSQDVDIRKLTRELRLPSVSYNHTGANFVDAVGPYHYLNVYQELWRRRKIILLIRDPRDMLVSGYFHAVHRAHSFTGSLSEYIRHPFTGIEKLLAAHQRWARYRRLTSGFLLQRYERMHDDPIGCISEALEFIGVHIDVPTIAQAVHFSEFGNMKNLERDGYFNSRAMRSGSADGAKVRKGMVGGFREHLAAGDIAFIDTMIQKIGYPFGGHGAAVASD